MTDPSAEFEALTVYRPTNKVCFVTAASLFVGHDAAINRKRPIASTAPQFRVQVGGPKLAEDRQNSCRLHRTKNLGADMKDESGSIRREHCLGAARRHPWQGGAHDDERCQCAL